MSRPDANRADAGADHTGAGGAGGGKAGAGAAGRHGPWVAGHLCLDLKPDLRHPPDLSPGALAEVGPLAASVGGAVGNVGIALARLGYRPHLLARSGHDPLAGLLRTVLNRDAHGATLHLVEAEASTSYSVVLNRPDADRTFLHHAGCNHAFAAEDLTAAVPAGAPLLHLGYPPLMRGLYHDEGRGLADALRSLRAAGTAVSLDMALPDPEGPSGRVDWRAFLQRVLPHVDLFLPSWGEIWTMLRPDQPVPVPSRTGVRDVAGEVLGFGPALVGLKLGTDGLYLRTAGSQRSSSGTLPSLPRSWSDREVLAPVFAVDVVDTTGAGDATIAGLLAAFLDGDTLEDAAAFACAVGAWAVEAPDGVAGLPPAGTVRERVARGWDRLGSAART